MQLPDDIKHLYILWLEEEQKVAIRNQTKMALTYSRAIQSVKKYPQAIKFPKELIQLKFIGEKVVATLSKKLEKYCDENGYDFPIEEEENEIVGNGVNDSDSAKDDDNTKPKKKKRAISSSSDKSKKKRKYVPQKNSGGYAILLTLYIHDKNQQGMLKDAIIRKAGQFCDKSFVSNPSTNQFYSAWSSVKSLQNNDLVDTFGKPMRFALTVDGQNLARLLKKEYNKENNLESSPLVERISNNNDNIDFLSPSKGNGDAANSLLNPALTSRTEHQIWKREDYDIIVILDNREIRSKNQRDFFSESLSSLNVINEVRSLPVGDCIWIARHKENGEEAVLDFIVERKRLDDLADSIKDGRFKEQKARLTKTGIANIYYLVEEQMSSDVSRYSDAIQTCISMTIVNSQFHLKRSKDGSDTAVIFSHITHAVSNFYNNKDLYVLSPLNFQSQNDYNKILNVYREKYEDVYEVTYHYDIFNAILSKTNLMTIREIFIRMLMTVKGVSVDKAVAIQQRFKTPKFLIDRYESCSSEQEKKNLISVALKEEVGNRKVGPALSNKIYEVWGV